MTDGAADDKTKLRPHDEEVPERLKGGAHDPNSDTFWEARVEREEERRQEDERREEWSREHG